MKKTNAFIVLILILTGSSLVACGSKKSNKNENVVMVKGDPIAFVANSSGDPKHLFKPEFFTDLGKLEFKISGFQETYTPQSFEEVVDEQKPENSKLTQNLDFILERTAEGHIIASSAKVEAAFEFRMKAGGYRLYSVKTSTDTSYEGENLDTDFKIIHNSSSKNGLAISTLIYGGKKGERGLYNVVIMNSHEKPSLIQKISEKFQYMAGPGNRMRWKEKSLELDVCNAPHTAYSSMVRDSAMDWKRASNDSVTVVANAKAQCRPFSDLNSKALYYVDGFVELPNLDQGILGVTLLVMNQNEQRFIDGDILILNKEFEDAISKARGAPTKLSDPEVVSSTAFLTNFKSTIVHEMGHFLGLHHQFDPNYKSIMSYDESIVSIQDYDKEAIQKLYVKSEGQKKRAPP